MKIRPESLRSRSRWVSVSAMREHHRQKRAEGVDAMLPVAGAGAPGSTPPAPVATVGRVPRRELLGLLKRLGQSPIEGQREATALTYRDPDIVLLTPGRRVSPLLKKFGEVQRLM